MSAIMCAYMLYALIHTKGDPLAFWMSSKKV